MVSGNIIITIFSETINNFMENNCILSINIFNSSNRYSRLCSLKPYYFLLNIRIYKQLDPFL